jgi:BRO family, N-terminal domain
MRNIKLFEAKKVRTHWDEEKELWYFSIIDVIEALTGTDRPRKYWSDLKAKLKNEGSQLSENIGQLKMISADGKFYQTDVADTAQILRLIQSIPSPKAEPFKQWLAQVGYERIEETEDPELSFDRAMETYLVKGYSKEWINQRLKSIEVRKELTDEWEKRGVKRGMDFAVLTDIITKAWSGKSVNQYKEHKN